MEEGMGLFSAHRTLANQVVIDLETWDDPTRFTKDDEDDPGRHPSLMAQTRIGEPSVMAVLVFPWETFDLKLEPNLSQARSWSIRSINLSRKSIVQRLKGIGVPESWRQSPLLRNSYPLVLDSAGRWIENPLVRLDRELGLCFDSKEAE
jgi:CRISPR-associated endonuclease/helicase Cas3